MSGPDMSAPDFLDTNVLVYAYDVSHPKKQRVAQSLVGRAVAGEMVISAQVLAEFSVTLLSKIAPPVSAKDLLVLLDALGPIRVITPDSDLVRRGVEAHAKYGVHFYDGLIIAAAERAGSARIWSEDLNAGQKYFGVAVENPFL
jgi:predicted nucleic acid-binding protein